MAAKYARATGGNWNTDATWSTTDGGAADTVKPTAADDVFLTATSGAVTIDAASVCRSINCTGYASTLTHNNFSLDIGDATAGASNIALKFSTTMAYTASAATSLFNFISTSATQQTVDFQSTGSVRRIGSATFNATSNGSWILSSSMQCASAFGTVTLTKGTLDINGQTCSWGLFNAANTNTKVLTLGSANITITGSGAGQTQGWLLTATGTTLTANTATITLSGASAVFNTGAFTWGGTVVFSGSGTPAINGSGATIANLTRTGTAVKTDEMQFSLTSITI